MPGFGDMDSRIRVEQATTEKNAFNEDVQTWGTLATVWASKWDVSDSESIRSGEVAAQFTTRFRIHWSTVTALIDERDRVIYDGRIYEIQRVKDTGRRKFREITALARGERP